jgi:hypothetical protein
VNRRPERLAVLLPGVVADLARRHTTNRSTNMSNPNEPVGYVIGRPVDAAEFHGDQALQLWCDDVFRTETEALEHHGENVDETGWTVYELRQVPAERHLGGAA